jgi:hypothetical protein
MHYRTKIAFFFGNLWYLLNQVAKILKILTRILRIFPYTTHPHCVDLVRKFDRPHPRAKLIPDLSYFYFFILRPERSQVKNSKNRENLNL